MNLQYLYVKFDGGLRNVLANEVPVGVTNRTMIMEPGLYTITLDGAPTAPVSQDVTLASTTVLTPVHLTFS